MLRAVNILSPDICTLQHSPRCDRESSPKAIADARVEDCHCSDMTGPIFAPAHLPGYDQPPGLSDESLEHQRKSKILVEYFAGWSIAHASYHRKFIAVTKYLEASYSKLGHVSFILWDLQAVSH